MRARRQLERGVRLFIGATGSSSNFVHFKSDLQVLISSTRGQSIFRLFLSHSSAVSSVLFFSFKDLNESREESNDHRKSHGSVGRGQDN